MKRASRAGTILALGILPVALALSRCGPGPSPQESPPDQPALQAAWLQLGPDGAAFVRVITDASTCPAATLDSGASLALTTRANPNPGNFKNRVCTAPVPPGTRSLTVAGASRPLHMLADVPKKVVVLGDSGCWQADCNADNWPLPTLARLAAARSPDLVIHAGDYNYRGTSGCGAYDGCCQDCTTDCGASGTACQGGIPGCCDSSATWMGDFFTPAAPLLSAAPWVMMRGNHELCVRAGTGFMYYLDPRSPTPPCPPETPSTPSNTPPYAVPLGTDLQLIVLDSANSCEGSRAAGCMDMSRDFARQFAQVETFAGRGAVHNWLLTHRPVWGISKLNKDQTAITSDLTGTLQSASGNRLPGIDLLLAGHKHFFEALWFETGEPPVVIVGTGGVTIGDRKLPDAIPGQLTFPPVPVPSPEPPPAATVTAGGRTLYQHGYFLMQPAGPGGSWSAWHADFHDKHDDVLLTCAFNEGGLSCVPPE